MDLRTGLSLLAMAITCAVMFSAAVSDWRKREVSNTHWLIMGISGLTFFTVYSINETGFRWEYLLLILGVLMIIIDMLWDREINPFLFYFSLALMFIIPLYGKLSDPVMAAWATIPICYIIFLGFYVLDVVRGGADTKCLITLSIMFPLYPYAFGLPLIEVPEGTASQILAFPISVFFIAGLMMIPLIFYFIVRNLREDGKVCRRAFHGYRMEIKKAKGSHVWPLEDVEDGKEVFIGVPQDEEMPQIYSRLEDAGYERIWVTPMIPFLIPIAMAVVFLFTIGNPLFLIL